MSELQVIAKRVGITERTAERPTAPKPASATLAAMLGISTPAVGAPRPPIKVPVAQPAPRSTAAVELRVPRDAPPISHPAPNVGRNAVTARVLGEALGFAEIVNRTLPADAEMDRLAARSLRARSAGRRPRKLSAK